MSTKTVNQHYVAQSYLSYFGNEKGQQLYVYDKTTEKLFHTSIRNVASEREFNDYSATLDILGYVNKPPGKAPGFLWILRVYKLRQVVRFGRLSQGGSPAEYRHLEPVSIEGATPVLTDAEFKNLKKKIFAVVS